MWASLVLDKSYNIDNYVPYLTAFAEDNKQYFPDTFLYFITNFDDYLTSILTKQKFNKYWEESNDKIFDTSLALLVLQNNNAEQILDSKDYLLSIQDDKGCWSNNIRNTAFILYSAFPKTSITDGSGSSDIILCEDASGFCMSSVSCADSLGIDLGSDLQCPSVTQVCCSKPLKQETCSQKQGTICNSNQECSIGTIPSSDSSSCCLGTCEISQQTDLSECEEQGGFCDSVCASNEESKSFSCTNTGDLCCVKISDIEKTTSKTWIWILAILIILVVLGIVFRNKLQEWIFRMKSGGASSTHTSRPSFPGLPPRPMQRPMPHRVLPPQSSLQRSPIKKPSALEKEFNETLNKLKEIGK